MYFHSFKLKAGFSPVLGLALFFSSLCWAEPVDKRPVQGISQNLFSKIGDIETLANDDNVASLRKALTLAKQTAETCKKCNDYEIAIIYRYLAWLHFQTGEVQEAIYYYEETIKKSPAIPIAIELEALLALSKTLFQEGDYADALQYLENWKTLSRDIPADIYFLEARIYYFLNRHAAALDRIKQAINIEEDAAGQAMEEWYLFARSLEYQQENYLACLAIQRKLLEHYNKDVHWRDLAIFYGLLGDEYNQIAAMDTAWILGGLKQESELLNFAWMLQNVEVPFKAAMVLENGFKQGKLQHNLDNLKQLAGAWYAAAEINKAIAAMEEAVAYANNGNPHAFLSTLYLETSNFSQAVESAQQGIKAGNLKEPGRLYINLGIALFEQNKFDTAISAFRRARDDKNTYDNAEKWLLHVYNQRLRAEQLDMHL